MQQPTESIQSMFPSDSPGMSNMASETRIDSYRSLDPSRASLEDYNRAMLLYTQRQIASFVDMDDSHRGSSSSGRSSASSSSGMARQANGPGTSVSNAAYLAEGKINRDMAGIKSAGYQGCALY